MCVHRGVLLGKMEQESQPGELEEPDFQKAAAFRIQAGQQKDGTELDMKTARTDLCPWNPILAIL